MHYKCFDDDDDDDYGTSINLNSNPFNVNPSVALVISLHTFEPVIFWH